MNLRFCTILGALLITFSSKAATPGDKELPLLKGRLQAADTQSDMNFASKELAEYWDRKVGSIENKITARLAARERKKFEESRKRWRMYRSREVEFRATFFEGGTVQPLIANIAYIELTQHRVSELESLLVSALNGRVDQEDRPNGVPLHR